MRVVVSDLVVSEAYFARNYDVTPDGQRILAVRVPDRDAPRRIDVVTHWLDELKHRVPH